MKTLSTPQEWAALQPPAVVVSDRGEVATLHRRGLGESMERLWLVGTHPVPEAQMPQVGHWQVVLSHPLPPVPVRDRIPPAQRYALGGPEATTLLCAEDGETRMVGVFADRDEGALVVHLLNAANVAQLPAVAAEVQRRDDIVAELRRHLRVFERRREAAIEQVSGWLREADGLEHTSENVDRHRALRTRAAAVCDSWGLATLREHDARRGDGAPRQATPADGG